MSEMIWLLIRWVHVMAAVVWVGGNLILAMVIVPYFRQNLPPVQRIKLLSDIGKRFEPIVWGCVLVLFFTGIGNIYKGIVFSSTGAIENTFFSMHILLVKLILFIGLLILTVLHSFMIAPKLLSAIKELDEALEELPSDVKPIRTQMAIVSSLMGVVSLLILLAAVALRMGI